MDELTFEKLPRAVTEIINRQERIEQLLLTLVGQPEPVADRWMTIDELCQYLPGKRKKCTIYKKVHLREIPFHKEAKSLAFLQSDIDAWIKSKRRKTNSEIKKDADDYLSVKKVNAK